MTYQQPEISLEALRILRGYTQKALGDAINKDPSTIIRWESGKTSPKIDDYYKIKNILDPGNEFFLQIKSS